MSKAPHPTTMVPMSSAPHLIVGSNLEQARRYALANDWPRDLCVDINDAEKLIPLEWPDKPIVHCVKPPQDKARAWGALTAAVQEKDGTLIETDNPETGDPNNPLAQQTTAARKARQRK